MNRIKELRAAKGWSTTDLAERVGTTQAQISKLELGKRRLTEEWMRRIAHALDCRPTDLLEQATLAEFDDDVEPHALGAHPDLEKSLHGMGLSTWQIASDVVEKLGFKKGALIVVNSSPEQISKLKTGDVVLAQIDNKEGKSRLILRGYFAPDLLLTNRAGMNTVISIEDGPFAVKILGIALPR